MKKITHLDQLCPNTLYYNENYRTYFFVVSKLFKKKNLISQDRFEVVYISHTGNNIYTHTNIFSKNQNIDEVFGVYEVEKIL